VTLRVLIACVRYLKQRQSSSNIYRIPLKIRLFYDVIIFYSESN